MVLFVIQWLLRLQTIQYLHHDRTKAIVLDGNYIKDNLDFGQLTITYIKSVHQLADIVTHAIVSGPFHASLSKLGMSDIYAQLEREN